MIKKTYGVLGLMEFLVVVALSARTFKIQFTGGSSSSRGIVPATYTTDNEIIQFAIENSKDFISGKIKLIKSVEIPEPARSVRPSIHNNAPEQPQQQEPAPVVQEPANDAANEQSGQQESAAESDGTTTSNKTIVNATCKEDVILYLKQNFGYTSASLSNKQKIVDAVNEHNLEIVGYTL